MHYVSKATGKRLAGGLCTIVLSPYGTHVLARPDALTVDADTAAPRDHLLCTSGSRKEATMLRSVVGTTRSDQALALLRRAAQAYQVRSDPHFLCMDRRQPIWRKVLFSLWSIACSRAPDRFGTSETQLRV